MDSRPQKFEATEFERLLLEIDHFLALTLARVILTYLLDDELATYLALVKARVIVCIHRVLLFVS